MFSCFICLDLILGPKQVFAFWDLRGILGHQGTKKFFCLGFGYLTAFTRGGTVHTDWSWGYLWEYLGALASSSSGIGLWVVLGFDFGIPLCYDFFVPLVIPLVFCVCLGMNGLGFGPLGTIR
jgi:hypothetical protein